MFKQIQKRDGTIENFSLEEFTKAINNAAQAVNVEINANKIALDAINILEKQHPNSDITSVEDSLDAIEISLMQNNYANVAKAFIIYRNRHSRAREQNSVFTRAIDAVTLDFEIKGNAAEWLWEVAHISSYCYTLYKILPQRIAHYFTENFIWIHSLPYFGRTIRNISFNLEELFSTEYFVKKGIKKPKRIQVLANHIIQLMDSIHDDIGGEHVYYQFDVSMGRLINALPQKPTKEEMQQAAEYFIYALNNKSTTHTSDKVNSPCLNIGSDTSESGKVFIKYMLNTINRITEQTPNAKNVPYIVYSIEDGLNWNETDINYDIFNLVLSIAQKRGGVTFLWNHQDKAIYSNGLITEPNKAINAQLTINLPKIALSSNGNFYESLHTVINVADEIIELNQKLLLDKTLENFPTINMLSINGKTYNGSEKFSNILEESDIVIGITGLTEAVKILNPDISFTEIADAAEKMLIKIKTRVHLQNNKYKIIETNDIKITNMLFDNERQRALLSQKGLNQYSPGVSLLPIGYNAKDRIELEKNLYQHFDSLGSVLIQKEKGKEEIIDGISKIKGLSATINII